MSETKQLMAIIKKTLKQQGISYRNLGDELGLSESSVKRMLNLGQLTIERLGQICKIMDTTLAELFLELEASKSRLQHLSIQQETELVADKTLLMVTVNVLNHWMLEDILIYYNLTKAECIHYLLILERIGLIELRPDNQIRLRIDREFTWIKDGPIQQFFYQEALPDFLSGTFNSSNEDFIFSHGMLTTDAYDELQNDLNKIRQKLKQQHEESKTKHLEKKVGVGMVLALRPWLPEAFQHLRR